MMSFICSWQFQKSTGLSGKTGHSKLTYVNELWSGDNHVTCCSIRNHQEIRSKCLLVDTQCDEEEDTEVETKKFCKEILSPAEINERY
jgi:hypothetical protein